MNSLETLHEDISPPLSPQRVIIPSYEFRKPRKKRRRYRSIPRDDWNEKSAGRKFTSWSNLGGEEATCSEAKVIDQLPLALKAARRSYWVNRPYEVRGSQASAHCRACLIHAYRSPRNFHGRTIARITWFARTPRIVTLVILQGISRRHFTI